MARVRNEPTINREPQQSREPGDPAELPYQDEMNKTAAVDRDRAAPSWLASTANRIRASESFRDKTRKDFCNKIGTNRPSALTAWSAPLMVDSFRRRF